jgi:ABC-type glycerol-3-phosphate transport system substrate-binding protein
MQYMYDLLWTHKIAIPPELMESRFDLVKSGVVGTWHIGPWFIADATANAPQLKYSLHPVPCHTTCDNLDTPETVAIPTGAKDPEASWAAIQSIMLQPELDLELSTIDGFLPAYAENLDRLGSAAPSNNELWAAYAEIGKGRELRPRQWTEGYADMVAVVGPELQAVWFNQKSVADGLAAAQQAGNEALKRARGG